MPEVRFEATRTYLGVYLPDFSCQLCYFADARRNFVLFLPPMQGDCHVRD